MEKKYESKFHEELHINDESAKLQIVVDSRSKGELLIFLENCQTFSFSVEMKESSNLTVFIQNKAEQEVSVQSNINMAKDSNCKMAVLDLQKDKMIFENKVNLENQGAYYELYTGQLCGKDVNKISNIEIQHKADHTTGIMHNFAVLFDRSYYEMVANGNIDKCCAQSESHQETRVLTLGKDYKTKVIPLLLIDENDVKASHALTIGQPDASQLYYLQSRGLTPAQAMGLLSVGYFMPVIHVVKEESLRIQLQEDMERKVGIYGN